MQANSKHLNQSWDNNREDLGKLRINALRNYLAFTLRCLIDSGLLKVYSHLLLNILHFLLVQNYIIRANWLNYNTVVWKKNLNSRSTYKFLWQFQRHLMVFLRGRDFAQVWVESLAFVRPSLGSWSVAVTSFGLRSRDDYCTSNSTCWKRARHVVKSPEKACKWSF